MGTTAVTLANGRTVEVQGGYDEIVGTLRPRQLSETGTRELTLANGQRLTIAVTGVLAVEETTETTRRPIGFQ